MPFPEGCAAGEPPAGHSGLIGRAPLLAEVERLLDLGTPVGLHGPAGVGKTALLDAIERTGLSRGDHVLRAGLAPDEQPGSLSALQALAVQSKRHAVGDRIMTGLLDALAGDVAAGCSGADPRPARLAWHAAMTRLAETGGVLVLLDDVQWLDAASADVLRYACRQLPAGSLRLVVTVGPVTIGSSVCAPSGLAALTGAGGRPMLHLDVPPLGTVDVIDLLAEIGVAAPTAAQLHEESGGLPALALALGEAVGSRPRTVGRPAPIPRGLWRFVEERLASAPDGVLGTLRYAALSRQATMDHLARAGCTSVEDHVRFAAAQGLLVVDEGVLRFTPPIAVRVIAGSMSQASRRAVHEALARAARSGPERLLHEALADPRLDHGRATELREVAERARRAGMRDLAAELFVLAARSCTADMGESRRDWLTTAVEVGALGTEDELVNEAVLELEHAEPTTQQRVRVRLALLELARRRGLELHQLAASAPSVTEQDGELFAQVLLHRARAAMVESRYVDAARELSSATELCTGPTMGVLRAEVLTELAICTRWLGRDAGPLIEEALTLPAPAVGSIDMSPRFVAAQFAMADDRLDVAWRGLQDLLPLVDDRPSQDTVQVLCGLVEVGARLGRCREVLDLAGRAARLTERLRLRPQTGWYATAVAQLAAGDSATAIAYAQRGVRLASERGDMLALRRHLLCLSIAQLLTGSPQEAAVGLRRIQEVEAVAGLADPTALRWHPELVTALARTGELAEADEVLASARAALGQMRAPAGILARLQCAESEIRAASGDLDSAAALATEAARVLARLGQPIEHARALLVLCRTERRRRRLAAAAEAAQGAVALLGQIQALPWLAVAHAELARTVQRGLALPDVSTALTPTEQRVTELVASGASNREIAGRLFLSVKTVEATLTRVYRKVGVRSRTQLVAAVGDQARTVVPG